MQCIYRIRNRIDGKYYLGSTNDFNRRCFSEHLPALRKGTHFSTFLQNAWNKYGEANFTCEVVEEVTGNNDVLLMYEQSYLDKGFELGILYNISTKAGNSGPLPKEVAQKMSISHLGKKHSAETKAKIRAANLGHIVTEETRIKLRISHSGENSFWYGKHHTGESKIKISLANKGKKQSLDHRSKIGIANRGKKRSEEERIRIRTMNKGRKFSKEHKAKISKGVAKPFPAFYNVKTDEFIAAGENLLALCAAKNLNYEKMRCLRAKDTSYTFDGWRLATQIEISAYLKGRKDETTKS